MIQDQSTAYQDECEYQDLALQRKKIDHRIRAHMSKIVANGKHARQENQFQIKIINNHDHSEVESASDGENENDNDLPLICAEGLSEHINCNIFMNENLPAQHELKVSAS